MSKINYREKWEQLKTEQENQAVVVRMENEALKKENADLKARLRLVKIAVDTREE